ncbi:MATE family efflux transporter [Dermatobacter hominis]|uniref:MATE family efflux transporter n=1 Tax=Dermatobacter hominis TaxID=2884263 RepID=UPI001D106819|nr:MATE family efflux transporter [Dermatobacter hominis]UDY37110.1 MATE family efflux transporter [Dermatobacter hominis]
MNGRELDRSIWRLAGPAFLTLTAEPLYLLVDTAVVGRIGGDALASLAVASTILLTSTGVLIFLTFGTAATVARLRGAGHAEQAAEQSVQGMWLGLACGLAAAALLAVLGVPLTSWLSPDASVAEGARTYLYISLLGVPAVCVTMAGTGALRGHVDARTPLVVTVVANLVNLAIEIPLVLGLGWGLAGSAAGTVLVQWGAAATYLFVVVRRYGAGLERRRPDRAALGHHLRIGRDLFVRTVALRAAFLAMTAQAGRRGAEALSAYQVALQWWVFLTFLLDGLEAAAQSLVGMALGAGDEVLARRTASRVLAWSAACGLVLGLATVVARNGIAGLFTDDPAVVALVTTSLVWVGVAQPLNGLASSLDGVLVGAGDQRFLAAAMVGSLSVLVLAGATLSWAGTGLWGVWLALIVFMASRVVFLGARFRTSAWHRTGAVA